jgi:hypothetical protein
VKKIINLTDTRNLGTEPEMGVRQIDKEMVGKVNGKGGLKMD